MDNRCLLFFLLVCILSCTKKIDNASVEDFSTTTQVNLNHITKVGKQYFICGGEKFTTASIFHFENNTLNEVSLPSNSTQKEIYSIEALNEKRLLAVTYDAGIYSSTDSGQHWQFIQSNIWQEFKDVAFAEHDSTVIVGRNKSTAGFISLGQNTGLGFDVMNDHRNFMLSDIDALPNGIMYCSGYGAILKSTNNGSTWDYTSAENDFYKAMAWRNNQEGIAVGYEGSIIKTVDGGTHWNFLRNGNNTVLKRLHFLDVAMLHDVVVAVGEHGLIMVSTNFGNDWKCIKKFTTKDIHAVYMEDEHTLLVAGSLGAFYRISI
jgi:photosystem II stability/assembly factor-like uncharacterized protein